MQLIEEIQCKLQFGIAFPWDVVLSMCSGSPMTYKVVLSTGWQGITLHPMDEAVGKVPFGGVEEL